MHETKQFSNFCFLKDEILNLFFFFTFYFLLNYSILYLQNYLLCSLVFQTFRALCTCLPNERNEPTTKKRRK